MSLVIDIVEFIIIPDIVQFYIYIFFVVDFVRMRPTIVSKSEIYFVICHFSTFPVVGCWLFVGLLAGCFSLQQHLPLAKLQTNDKPGFKSSQYALTIPHRAIQLTTINSLIN